MSNFSSNRQFSLALEALAELLPELETKRALTDAQSRLIPVPLAPALESVLLHDPAPGPILVSGDPGAGKTAFLQNVARGAGLMHAPEDVQFGVITAFPDEWVGFGDLPHCAGIFPIYASSAVDFLYSLSGWAHANQRGQQSVVLLLDDLESMEQLDFDVRQTLRWLLLRGPARRVWPVVTVNAERTSQVEAWLEAFRTRMLGHMAESHPGLFDGEDGPVFQSLKAGLQFALREGREWMKFWVPT